MTVLKSVWRKIGQRGESGWLFTLAVAAVFGAVLVYGHLHHELWRDELHCFGVGRNADGLWELLTGDRRYDGHPFLWYYLLHLVSLITRSYHGLTVTTWLLAVGAAVMWLRYAPIPPLLKVLALGSYYLVYEYGVISRSYTLGLFIAFAFCVLYRRQRIRYVTLAVLLALLAATSVYGTAEAIALAVFLFTRGPVLEPAPPPAPGRRVTVPAAWVAGVVIFMLGLAVVYLTSRPPEDAYYRPGPAPELTFGAFKDAASTYWRAMFPFRSWKDWDWQGSDYLGDGIFQPKRLAEYAGVIWLVGWLVALRRAPRVAVTYGFGILIFAAIQFAIYPGGWRHIGHSFILLLVCVWLHARDRMDARRSPRLMYGMLTANLLVLLATGYAAYVVDRKDRFSRAEEVFHLLKDRHLDRLPAVGEVDAAVSPIAILLDRAFFYPVSGEMRQTPVFHNRRFGVSDEDLLTPARSLAREGTGRALIITSTARGPLSRLPAGVKLVYASKGSTIVYDESYWVYLVDTKPK